MEIRATPAGRAREAWRPVEVFLADGLTRGQVNAELRSAAMRTASDCGEFVRAIRIEGTEAHTGGWRRWRASYLLGPPRMFRGAIQGLARTESPAGAGGSKSIRDMRSARGEGWERPRPNNPDGCLGNHGGSKEPNRPKQPGPETRDTDSGQLRVGTSPGCQDGA